MKRLSLLFLLLVFVSSVIANKTTWSGTASYYANKFEGRKTANGEIFSNSKFTCANNFLPLGTHIKVTNVKNGKTVDVKVNDRLHAKNTRLVDLSRVAAEKLGIIQSGLGTVSIQVIKPKKNIEQAEE